MSNKIFVLKSYIRSVILENSTPQSETTDEFGEYSLGQYAFAQARRGMRDLSVPDEPDTKYEEELHNAIRGHIMNSTIPLTPKHVENIKKFISSGKYKDVFFNPPPGTPIYRGMPVSVDRLKKILNWKDEGDPPKSGEQEVNYTYRSWKDKEEPGHSSSWTTDPNIADLFDFTVDDRRKSIVTFIAAPGQEHKFFDFKKIYEIIPTPTANEAEVAALGPIKVSKIKWYTKS